ncbi:hypothetical protein [uncultured Maribacter sp.]|uniref:hypothetical protein n=1 Tax=uncultured Maribacter sp. TaxID=431308 RepID=UPI00262337F3|nr:hypothetical protein [uncultured Maribacter sp.]
MEKINTKIKKKLDNIINLKKELKNWKDLSEKEVFELIKNFEKTPRDEGSNWYNEVFTDNEFATILLKIGKEYKSNTKMNVYVISSLGNMMSRYNLKETKNIYEYFLDNLHEKGLSVYVSLFFTDLEHFANYSEKWDYIMSVKDMKPSKIGESSFETIIKSRKDNIPNKYKSIVNNHFIMKAEKANSEYGKKHYLDLAEEFK